MTALPRYFGRRQLAALDVTPSPDRAGTEPPQPTASPDRGAPHAGSGATVPAFLDGFMELEEVVSRLGWLHCPTSEDVRAVRIAQETVRREPLLMLKLAHAEHLVAQLQEENGRHRDAADELAEQVVALTRENTQLRLGVTPQESAPR